MSFSSDKKNEHERLAEKALAKKEYAQAFFHTAKSADFGFNLAEQSEGKVARAYLKDAYELLEIATLLKEKARSEDEESPRKVLKENESSTAEEDKAANSEWQLKVRLDIKLDDVAGLDDVKTAIRDDVINVMSHPEIYDRFKVEGGGGEC